MWDYVYIGGTIDKYYYVFLKCVNKDIIIIYIFFYYFTMWDYVYAGGMRPRGTLRPLNKVVEHYHLQFFLFLSPINLK